MHCAGCGIELEGSGPGQSGTLGDCYPLCAACLRTAGRRVHPSRQTLVKALFSAGRPVSRCQACGAQGECEFHFLVPLVRGGVADSGNLLVLCRSCHQAVHQGARLRLHIKDNDNPGMGETAGEPVT
jgi:hypothetical protein